MKKIKYTNFETVNDILKKLNIKCDSSKELNIAFLNKCWSEIVNENLLKQSKIYDILIDNSIKIICKDSYVANELYLSKNSLLKQLNDKSIKNDIIITDIRFDYKKWE